MMWEQLVLTRGAQSPPSAAIPVVGEGLSQNAMRQENKGTKKKIAFTQCEESPTKKKTRSRT